MNEKTAEYIAKLVISQYDNEKSYLCRDMNDSLFVMCDGNGNYYDANGPYEPASLLKKKYGSDVPDDFGVYWVMDTIRLREKDGVLVKPELKEMTKHIMDNWDGLTDLMQLSAMQVKYDEQVSLIEESYEGNEDDENDDGSHHREKKTVRVECEYTQENMEYRKEGDFLYIYEFDELCMGTKIPCTSFEGSGCINFCGGDGSFVAEYEYNTTEELVAWLREILNNGQVLLVNIEVR